MGLPATTLVLDENTSATKTVVNARTLTSLRTAAGMFVTFIYSVANLVLLGSVLATALSYPPATADMTCLIAFGAGSQIQVPCHATPSHVPFHHQRYYCQSHYQ